MRESTVMVRYMKVPVGEEPMRGTVICHGGTHNIWKSPVDLLTEYEGLSEGEAQLEGVKMKPGTMMPTEVDSLKSRMQNDYGIDISQRTIDIGENSVSVETFLRDYTLSVPSDWTVEREDPFNIRDWL